MLPYWQSSHISGIPIIPIPTSETDAHILQGCCITSLAGPMESSVVVSPVQQAVSEDFLITASEPVEPTASDEEGECSDINSIATDAEDEFDFVSYYLPSIN